MNTMIWKKVYEIRSRSQKKSLVQVHFADQNRTLTYFNDRFNLSPGDMVFVDGKLEGVQGIVTEVNYNFKIKISDYKRVLSVADTEVHDSFYMTKSHFLTFFRDALPAKQIATWYFPPLKEDDELVRGTDDQSGFLLEDLKGFHVSSEIFNRGIDYYRNNKVLY